MYLNIKQSIILPHKKLLLTLKFHILAGASVWDSFEDDLTTLMRNNPTGSDMIWSVGKVIFALCNGNWMLMIMEYLQILDKWIEKNIIKKKLKFHFNDAFCLWHSHTYRQEMTTASEGYVMAELISPYVRSVPAPGSIAKMETSVRFKSVYFVILTSKKNWKR